MGGDSCGGADRAHRRFQRRAARKRCVEPQGAARRGQPYADRGRDAGTPPGSRRLGRSRAPLHCAADSAFYLVELPGERLGGVEPRPTPRSYVGDACPQGRGHRAPRCPACAKLGATLGPCPAGDGVFLLSDAAGEGARRAARAIDALRRGWPLRVAAEEGTLDVLAVESARDAALAQFASSDLLLSGERAVTLKLTNQRAAATPGPVRLAAAATSAAEALAIADPALDLAHPFKGPFRTMATGGEAAAAAAMTMARHAGLLPAFFVREAVGAAETECTAED